VAIGRPLAGEKKGGKRKQLRGGWIRGKKKKQQRGAEYKKRQKKLNSIEATEGKGNTGAADRKRENHPENGGRLMSGPESRLSR